MTYRDFWQQLTTIYETGEAKAVARYVYDHCYGLSTADLLCGKDQQLSAEQQLSLHEQLRRLLSGEPVQYVTGMAEFGALTLHVEPGVLIPRPETYELCQWIRESQEAPEGETKAPSGFPWGERLSAIEPSPPGGIRGGLSLLDIGTGSGCIAITLALKCPQAEVTAWDISPKALHVARENAQAAQARIQTELQDALHLPDDNQRVWDIIVSNPPYICRKEAAAMEANVLNHEPHLALFVPDDDPLLFYRAIARYAARSLKPAGQLFFEINPLYHSPLVQLLKGEGFVHIASRSDQFGKTRFVRATRHPHPQ